MKLTGNIFMLLLSSVLLLLPTGCVREDFPVHCAEQGKEVTLQISISQSPLTKATAAPTGSVLNNYEKTIKELRIYAFYNKAFAGHQYIKDVDAYAQENGTLKFYMDLTMFVIGEQKVDFYVIANESSMYSPSLTLSETTTEDQLKSMHFASLNGIHDGQAFLPNGFVHVAQQSYVLKMEDAHTVNNATGHKNHSIVETVYAVDADGNPIKDNPLSAISFDLIRPLGKLCIFAAKAPGTTGDLTVCGIRMLENGTRRNNFLMRQSTETLKNMSTTLVGGLDLHISAETGGSKKIEKTLTTAGSTTESHYDCVLLHDYYPHENAYGASPGTWNKMEYYEPIYDSSGNIDDWTFAESQAQSEAEYKGNILEMKYYFGSDPSAVKTQKIYLPPIERNRYYGIYCSIKNAGGISIQFNVSKWDPVQENWTFEYNYPDYVDLYPLDIDNTDPQNPKYIYPAQPTLSYSTDHTGDFKARFKIWGPSNIEWSPVLDVKNVTVNGVTTNASNEHYQYEVFEIVDGTLKPLGTSDDNKTYGESNNEYEIHVKALKSENLNAIIRLGISFIPKWDEDNHMLLLINGASVGNCSWPSSGTLPEWIEIKQVEVQSGTGGGTTESGGTTEGGGTT